MLRGWSWRSWAKVKRRLSRFGLSSPAQPVLRLPQPPTAVCFLYTGTDQHVQGWSRRRGGRAGLRQVQGEASLDGSSNTRDAAGRGSPGESSRRLRSKARVLTGCYHRSYLERSPSASPVRLPLLVSTTLPELTFLPSRRTPQGRARMDSPIHRRSREPLQQPLSRASSAALPRCPTTPFPRVRRRRGR